MQRFLTFAAILCLAACSEDSVELRPLRAEGCGSVDSCPSDWVCMNGACVGGGQPSRPLRMRVISSRDGRVAPVEFGNLRFVDGPVLSLDVDEIALPFSAFLDASARTAEGEAVAVRVTARAVAGRLAGGVVVSAASVNPGSGPRFNLSLAPWWPDLSDSRARTYYDIRLTPDPEHLPPWDQIDFTLDGEGLHTFEMPSAANLLRIEGEVLVSRTNATGLRGLRVFAVNERGKRVSTESPTDDHGQFSIRLWPSDEERTIELRVTSTASEFPLPTLTVPFSLPPNSQSSEPLYVVAYLGETGTALERAGRIIDRRFDADVAVPQVLVRFRGHIGNGDYEIAALSDALGTFSVPLYPGKYVVDLEPPVDSGFRIARHEVEVEEAHSSLELVAKPRTLVSGRVVDVTGDPLPSTIVRSRLVQARYGDARLERLGERPPSRTFETQSDEEGWFAFQIDPGDHVLTLAPAPNTGLPSFPFSMTVPPELARPVELGTIEAPPAAAVTLKVVDEQREPIDGATIEAWWIEEEGDVSWAGVATTNADGEATVAVPNDSK